jgi:NAD-dependent SIR2 family protein deacetylase
MSLEIDPVLIERFAHGNGTVFVGAGISLGSRLPSWRELMEPLKIDLGEEVDASASYLEIAELYESKHSRRDLVEYLKDRLGDVRFELTKAHELIVGLPVQRIYTTNFDNLLEQASSKRRLNRNVIIDASHIGFSDTSRLSIIKLHGDLSDINSLVISASDYYGYFTKNPAVADLLKVELQTRGGSLPRL